MDFANLLPVILSVWITITTGVSLSPGGPGVSLSPGGPGVSPSQGGPGVSPSPGGPGVSPIPGGPEHLTSETTNRLQEQVPIKQGSADARIQFTLSINAIFDADLTNKSSTKYQLYKRDAERELHKAYIGTPGFKYIEILNIRNGSITVDYIAVFDGHNLQKDQSGFIDQVKHSVIPKLGQVCIHNDSVNSKMLNETMNSVLIDVYTLLHDNGVCKLLNDPCPIGYDCIGNASNGVAYCYDRCLSNANYCNRNGECYVDYRTNDMRCRCHETEKYYFSGPNCNIKSPKLPAVKTVERLASDLSAKEYGIMAGSSAGAVLVIIIAVLIVRCVRKRNRKSKEDNTNTEDKSNVSDVHASVPLAHLHVHQKDNSAFDNIGNIYDYGQNEINRKQRVYRDPQTGEEAIIYQPTIMTGLMSREHREHTSAQSEHSFRRPHYDYIDSEEIYKIKRPRVRESGNWPL